MKSTDRFNSEQNCPLLAGGVAAFLFLSFSAIFANFSLSCAAAMAESSEASAGAAAANALKEDPHSLPLRGLPGKVLTVPAGLGVYPQLDKGLLVTPGPHPEHISTPLSGIIEAGLQVKGKVEGADSPRGKFQGVKISVENNSDRPVIFDGDASSIKVAGSEVACVPLAKLAELSVLPEQSKSLTRKIVTDLKATGSAAITVGWAQTIRDQRRGSGPIVGPDGGRFGLDEQRRTDQLRRFGKRVLWPGENTSGVLYFDSPSSLSGGTVSLPVSSYYDQADRSVILLHN